MTLGHVNTAVRAFSGFLGVSLITLHKHRAQDPPRCGGRGACGLTRLPNDSLCPPACHKHFAASPLRWTLAIATGRHIRLVVASNNDLRDPRRLTRLAREWGRAPGLPAFTRADARALVRLLHAAADGAENEIGFRET